MNPRSIPKLLDTVRFRTVRRMRFIAGQPRSMSFEATGHGDGIGRIYVINLDRKPDRWRDARRELERIRDRTGAPLSSMSRRFSAIDARYLRDVADDPVLQTHYTLADQLAVAPERGLSPETTDLDRRIDMTPQEIAIALSHIAVWRLIAQGDVAYTLVLEDDVYFERGFGRRMDEAWAALGGLPPFDIMYVSFHEARSTGRRVAASMEALRVPDGGLWQLSGYVLSTEGARKLLDRLPARGPIDLWLNHQFAAISVLSTRRPLIHQRPDLPSTNSYSVLPILSQLGVLTRERPSTYPARHMPRPVIAYGDPGSGLTSLAMALSVLGYRCCSDLADLPADERSRLFTQRRPRAFDAYVNIGTLGAADAVRLAASHKDIRIIRSTSRGGGDAEAEGELEQARTLGDDRFLLITRDDPDRWQTLSRFLRCEYPAVPYPCVDELGQRPTARLDARDRAELPNGRWLRADTSPWVVPLEGWPGIRVDERRADADGLESLALWSDESALDHREWTLRDDTFPSNLALFRRENVSVGDRLLRLELREERTAVRSLTSAAVASRRWHRFGRFEVEIRPAGVAGLITGVFLHRNAPRQEIDIEFLGRDTTRMLVNIYYNPGVAGSKLEFGYRGAPAMVDLGFDAAMDVHLYEIEWRPDAVRWSVDGRLVHERVVWGPTPIPDLPMEFNVNLWHSRSVELAGKLDARHLPAAAHLSDIRIVAGR